MQGLCKNLSMMKRKIINTISNIKKSRMKDVNSKGKNVLMQILKNARYLEYDYFNDHQ